MDAAVLADQQNLTFISTLWTPHVVQRTYKERLPVRKDGEPEREREREGERVKERERESKESVPSAGFDDEDDDDRIFNTLIRAI